MILGLENRPQTVSELASQSHIFYVSGGKSIDMNISYWFVIDYCSLVTQWLMITLFFGPEGHVSYSLTFLHVWEYNKAPLDSVSPPSPWSSVGLLILTFPWIFVSCFSFSHRIELSETLLTSKLCKTYNPESWFSGKDIKGVQSLIPDRKNFKRCF